MLYKYPYIKHDARKLHTYICLLMRRLKDTPLISYDDSLFHADLLVKINRSPNFKTYMTSFVNGFLSLNRNEKIQVYQLFVNINSIEQLSKDVTITQNLKISDLPQNVRDVIENPSKVLFKYMFKSTLKVKPHYKEFLEKVRKPYKRYCPFCGLEELIPAVRITPDGKTKESQQDYDHLLYKDEYPFAAVNMKNLAPMGSKCNQKYKLTKDLIFDKDGNRIVFYYPYHKCPDISIDLTGSPIPDDNDDGKGWIINFKPNTDKVETWAYIFEIRVRYKELFEDGYFDTWLEQLRKYIKRLGLVSSATSIKKAIEEYIEDIDELYFAKKKVQKGVFELLLAHATDDYLEDLAAVAA